MKQVNNDSRGKIKLGPGTLYGAIKRMLEEKLISEVSTGQTRRKYYKLTEKGRSIFSSELRRLNTAVELAKKRKLMAGAPAVKLAFSYV